MSVSKWRYTEECNGRPCPGDCDHCSFEPADLISRADAIEAVQDHFNDNGFKGYNDGQKMMDRIKALPSAESNPTVVRCKTMIPYGDFREWAKRIREDNPNVIVIPFDAEVASADAIQGWIPCSEKMPKELERVNVTWLNHKPPFYYQHIKDIPQTDTAVYYRGKWYWWDATVIDVLAEYGEDCNAEQIDKDIEVVAWMPLPTPYKGGDDE